MHSVAGNLFRSFCLVCVERECELHSRGPVHMFVACSVARARQKKVLIADVLIADWLLAALVGAVSGAVGTVSVDTNLPFMGVLAKRSKPPPSRQGRQAPRAMWARVPSKTSMTSYLRGCSRPI